MVGQNLLMYLENYHFFIARFKISTPLKKELVSYAGISTAILYVDNGNGSKTIPINYFFVFKY